jgi:hypothetical protein
MLTGEGGYKHKFNLYFHFAPMALKKEKDELGIETDNKTGANIAIAPLETDGIKMEIEKGWVSYSYGRKVEAPIVKYSKTADVPAEFVTVIFPIPSVEELGMKVKDILRIPVEDRINQNLEIAIANKSESKIVFDGRSYV